MSLRDAMAGIKEAKAEPATQPQQIDLEDVNRRPLKAHTINQTMEQLRKDYGIPQPTGREGKRSNPDFEKIGVYVRKDTRRRALRKFEDTEGGKELSDLIENLLHKYAGD